MMVTFVSQCEKKALKKTRRVLDAFANRIGNRTWQTVITDEGLQAVKKLLRKTASKNTTFDYNEPLENIEILSIDNFLLGREK